MSLKYDSIDKRLFFMSLNYDLNDKRFLFMSLKYDLNDKKFLFMSLKYDLNDKIFLFMSLNYDLNDKSLELVHTNIIHMDCNKFFFNLYIYIYLYRYLLIIWACIKPFMFYTLCHTASVYESDELKFNFFKSLYAHPVQKILRNSVVHDLILLLEHILTSNLFLIFI